MLQDQSFAIGALHAAYARGLRPAAVVEEAYRRLEAADDPGIFLHRVAREAAQAEAAKLGAFDPAAKPLWGIPFAIKDNIDAAGVPTTAACPAFAYTAEADAFVVAALRAAGAILIGKTNLDQFATGLVGLRTPYPAPRNALDPDIVPGGSSSGSAVAVARDIVSFALGTDTAGSGRVPAALNGIVGLKPSLGALSNTGVVPACRTLDTVSVFARGVEDAYRVFRVAAAYDPADAYAREFPAPPRALVSPPVFRVGAPDAASRRFDGDAVQAASFDAALETLAARGAEIVEIDFTPFYDVAEMLYDGPWVAERLAAIEDLLRRDPDAVHPVTRRVIEVAERFSSADVFRAFYRLQELKRDIDPALAGLDMLCVPSIPTFATVAEAEADPIGPNARLGTYTNFVNLLDMCAIAVPTAPRSDGRPGSVTLLAAAGRDAQVAAVARVFETSAPAPSETATPQPAPDEIAIAVVGAHMSGLPLNGELTRLGARFLYAAKTTPDYRLFSLPGGPPFRPGLLRAGRAETGGAAVALEVWALPASRFGDFVRGIPRPLGIGTLTLDTGEAVKGFLCEASGTAGAEDVTAHGGWRAYLDSRTFIPSPKPQSTQESDHA